MLSGQQPGWPTLRLAIIEHLEDLLAQQGMRVALHFELEGMYRTTSGQELDFSWINVQLRANQVQGQLKKEYWPFQWEFVSDFSGQSPIQEAGSLAKAMQLVPKLLRQHGASEVMLQPIVWRASQERYVAGSSAIFGQRNGMVHVPNAIQLNLSVQDETGTNLMAESGLGEWLQYQLLQTSYANCLLFLPEHDAFKRLRLRQDFGLDDELSSPYELSGGHQGSIALYKQKGKHNQPMGRKTLLYSHQGHGLVYHDDWKPGCRVEHRLGATSQHYDPHLNVMFALLNVLDAVTAWQQSPRGTPKFDNKALPTSLFDTATETGAMTIFEQDTWLQDAIDHYCQKLTVETNHSLGYGVKQHYLHCVRRHLARAATHEQLII